MKHLFIMMAIFLAACTNTQTENTGTKEPVETSFYLGTWALDLDYENSNVGWLEVTQEDDYLDGRLLWRWGSVTPVEFVFAVEGELFVTRGRNIVRERDADGNPSKTHHLINWLNIKKSGDDMIEGIAYFPGPDGKEIEMVSFTGKKTPPVGPAPDLKSISYEDPQNLIADNDLSGWVLNEPNAENGWSVENGVLLNKPVQKEGEDHIFYGNLRSTETFNDFNLSLEVKVPEGSNSGIYLKGLYEIQVSDSYNKETDSHNMGALYSRITPSVSAEKPAGTWQSLDITLYKRHLNVVLNGTTIIDNKPVKGVTGGAIRADEFQPGPLLLQGDHGAVSYRNVVIREISE